MRWSIGRRVLALAAAFVALLVLGIGVDRNGDPRATAPHAVAGAGDVAASDPGGAATVTGRVQAPSARPTGTPRPPSATPRPVPRASPAVVSPVARPPRPTPAAAAARSGRPPRPTAVRPESLPPPPTLDLVIGSFNVLGASHTSPRGQHPGMASGRVRAGRAAQVLRRHGLDVVGFQELQSSQLAVLRQRTDLDFYPGSDLAPQDSENSIGWRRDRWELEERHVVQIPYFDGGLRAMPYVRLRSRSTGLAAWFANFHNPADTAQFPHQQRYRLQATRIEVALVNALARTGLPVLVTGDMNERSPYFCRFTAATPMLAARGGSNSGRCRARSPRAVDWIFGSPGVRFTGYAEDRSHLVDITTDHPVIVARARIAVARPDD